METANVKKITPGAGLAAGRGTASDRLKAEHRKTRVFTKNKDGVVTGWTYPKSLKQFVASSAGREGGLDIALAAEWRKNKKPVKRVRRPRVTKASLGGEIKTPKKKGK